MPTPTVFARAIDPRVEPNRGDPWQERALCWGVSEAWDPWGGIDRSTVSDRAARRWRKWEVAEAKEICGRCPARRSCLVEAFRRDEQYTVCGGFDMVTEQGLARLWLVAQVTP